MTVCMHALNSYVVTAYMLCTNKQLILLLDKSNIYTGGTPPGKFVDKQPTNITRSPPMR